MPKLSITIGLATLIGAAALIGATIQESGIIKHIEGDPSYTNVVRSVGGVICPEEKWFRQNEIGFAGLYVGNQQQRCTQWTGIFPEIIIAATTVNLNSGPKPLVIYFPTHRMSNKATVNTVIVEIVGGPSGSISPSVDNIILPNLVKDDLTAVSLGYTGTLYGSMYPKASYQLAVEDVVEYIKKIRNLARMPTKIVLLGESLGGRIAIDAAHRMPVGLRPDYTVLVNPLMLSPINANRNFAINLKNNLSNDSFITTKLVYYQKQPWEKVGTIPLFNAFFEKEEKEKSLKNIVELSPMIHPLIIFGADDNIIGINDIYSLSPKTAEIVKINGMGHHPNKDDEKHIASIIESAIGVVPSVP